MDKTRDDIERGYQRALQYKVLDELTKNSYKYMGAIAAGNIKKSEPGQAIDIPAMNPIFTEGMEHQNAVELYYRVFFGVHTNSSATDSSDDNSRGSAQTDGSSDKDTVNKEEEVGARRRREEARARRRNEERLKHEQQMGLEIDGIKLATNRRALLFLEGASERKGEVFAEMDLRSVLDEVKRRFQISTQESSNEESNDAAESIG